MTLYIIVKIVSFGSIDFWIFPNLLNTRLGRKPYSPRIQITFITRGCTNDVMTWPKEQDKIFHTHSQSTYEP
uniref:Ovule protein n=1 Tax=Panagrolaimus sp. PS1159 TaxID=55785 RepID=A0AC35FHB5_9BILA